MSCNRCNLLPKNGSLCRWNITFCLTSCYCNRVVFFCVNIRFPSTANTDCVLKWEVKFYHLRIETISVSKCTVTVSQQDVTRQNCSNKCHDPLTILLVFLAFMLRPWCILINWLSLLLCMTQMLVLAYIFCCRECLYDCLEIASPERDHYYIYVLGVRKRSHFPKYFA